MAQDKEQHEEGSKRGRPRSFQTPEELQQQVEQYLHDCWVNERAPSMVGLARFLDISRQTLYDYENHDGFPDTIKKAREAIEDEWVQKLAKNSTGAIFMLKNFGWTDKQEIDLSSYDFEVGHDTDESEV